MSILKLVRFPNLVIVACTQLMLYYCVILPPLSATNIGPDLAPFHFHLFVLTTLIITAGGYIINDLIDYEVDLVNRPKKVIIRKEIPIQIVYWLYYFINLVGFALSIYLAFSVNEIRLANIYPLAVLGLIVYSTHLKGKPLIGNLIIALYCAAVAWIIWFSQKEALKQLAVSNTVFYEHSRIIFWWYILFAFISTFFRELVKDIEDIEGDHKSQLRTVPIIWGLAAAKRIAGFAGSLLLVAVIFLINKFNNLFQDFGTIFLYLGLLLPILIALFLLFRANTKSQYHQISQLAKWIMAAGILLLLFLK